MEFFSNQLIQSYLNNTLNLHPSLYTLCCVIPTKWRSYREQIAETSLQPMCTSGSGGLRYFGP